MPQPRKRSRKTRQRKPTKAQQQEQDQGEWFTIRKILDERIKSKCVEYLVDWDDNPNTGESYAPSWSREVTDEARLEWEQLQAHRLQTPSPKPPPVASPDNCWESQSPRPANWRQLKRSEAPAETDPSADATPNHGDGNESDNSDTPLIKRRKTDQWVAHSEEPVPSITSTASVDDSAIEGSSPAHAHEVRPETRDQLAVEIHKDTSFDTSEFFSVTNTQSTGPSSQSVAALEQDDQRLLLSSQLSHNVHTVPDSQASNPPPSQDTLNNDASPDKTSQGAEDSGKTKSTIPDSYEDSQTFTRRSSGEQAHSTTPQHDASAEAHNDPSTESGTTTSDIPSRQPVPQQQSSDESAKQDSSLKDSTPTTTDLPEPIHDPVQPAVAVSPPQITRPPFLTQPRWNHPILSDSQDSLSSRIPETSLCATEGSPSKVSRATNHQQQEPRASNSPRASQAAQPLSQEYFSFSPLSYSRYRMNQGERPSINMPEGVSAVIQLQSLIDWEDGEGPPALAQETTDFSTPAPVQGGDGAKPGTFPSPTLASEERPAHPALLASQTVSELGHVEPGAAHAAVEAGSSGSVEFASQLHGQRSAVDELMELADLGLPPLPSQDEPESSTILPDQSPNQHSLTISPADITRSLPPGAATSIAMSAPVVPHMLTREVPSSPNDHEKTSSEEVAAVEDPRLTRHIITLPFQASIRPRYDNAILGYRSEVYKYGEHFSEETFTEPDEGLVRKIDQLFNDLRNLCDYPETEVDTADISSTRLAKYFCDANPKFSFVYELLNGLENKTKVLIVARSHELLELLFKVGEALGIGCSCKELSRETRPEPESLVQLSLALATERIDPQEFDVVVGFDHGFSASPVARMLPYSQKSPLILILVTTHSLDHIDLHEPEEADTLERRNMLLSGIISARRLVSDPDHGNDEPYQLAKGILNYLNGHAATVPGEQMPVPEEILDVYMSSQTRSQRPPELALDPGENRKRKLNDDEDASDEDNKRIRTAIPKAIDTSVNEPPLPDEVCKLLKNVPTTDSLSSQDTHIQVPLRILEALARKNAEIERQLAMGDREAEYQSVITGLETRVEESERSSKKMYEAHRAALSDRTEYETAKSAATRALRVAQEAAQSDAEKAERKIHELEEELRRQAASGGPNVAALEEKLKEADGKVESLERRLANANRDADYARGLYQDASTSASAMRGEISELKYQQDILQRKASENLVRVHEIQRSSETKQHLLQIAYLQTRNKEMQVELERARDELRQAKNGRQTRQASVPRSPHMGVMSPRAPGGGRPYGGAPTSRGSSPTPAVAAAAAVLEGSSSGMLPTVQFLTQQTGNGRFSHLKE